jgi:CarD family transcriptional regulator
MMFQVGDQAVYPAHGVGVIKGVESREIGGKRQSFYILKVLDTGMTIMVPTQNAQAIGMRAVIEQEKVEKVYEILRQRDVPIEIQTWERSRPDPCSRSRR